MKTAPKKTQRGIALLLTMTILSALFLGGMAAMNLRVTNLRTSRESLRGKMAYYCAEAGLAIGRDYFRAHASSWNDYMHTGFVHSGWAAPSATSRLPFSVRIVDNVDEFPPTANDATTDHDQIVILEATCTDPDLNTPITLRQYLTAVPPGIGVGGGGPPGAPVLFDLTYNTNPDPHGPSLSGNATLSANGGLGAGAGLWSPEGLRTIGVDVRDDVLKLATTPTTMPFIWMANSADGTVSKLNTDTGQELGRYYSGPSPYGNPSRTSVDLDGNVWVGNRANSTLTKFGLKEAGNCVDRNGDGVISSSVGGTDVRAWSGSWGDGVAGAQDECVLLHIGLSYPGISTPGDIRAVTVDRHNNVFAGGEFGGGLFKIRGSDGVILGGINDTGNHYGGLVDGDGNVWIASGCAGYVQKYPPDLSSVQRINVPLANYGIAIDPSGKIWMSEWGSGRFLRMNPDGTGQALFSRTGYGQGLAVAPNGDVWLAGSMYEPFVDHYNNNGQFIYRYTVGGNPTGVAIDAAGRVWSSNYSDDSASRIDPTTHQVDTFPIGAHPYNYSDMTGFILRNITAQEGSWSVRRDCGTSCHFWRVISWSTLSMPAGTTVTARARAAADVLGLGGAPWRNLTSGQDLPATAAGLEGRVIELELRLTTTTNGVSPVVDWVSITPWAL